MKQTFKKTVFLFSLMLLSSCAPKPPTYSTAGEDIQSTMNSSIQSNSALNNRSSHTQNLNSALLPPLTVQPPTHPDQPQEHRFNVNADNMPAKAFFMGLVASTPCNMLIEPNATGRITLSLKNVTIDQALDAARDMYGYQYKKTTLGYEILSPKMTTQVFTINYLNIKRTGESQTQLISTDITTSSSNTSNLAAYNNMSTNTPSPTGAPRGSGSTITTKADNDFWTGLKTTMDTLVGNKEGRWVVVNPQASVIMVHAYPEELHEVSDYLGTIQNNLQREVIIEAKILEITLSDNYQAGINWNLLTASQGGSAGLSSEFATGGQIFSLAISGDHGNFNSAINLLARQGNVQVLSSPRISTINNQEAVIKVGSDQFFVTGYTSNITPNGSTNTTSQSVALNPFFSGITLDVTPQISDHGEVTLYIHPSISHVQDQNKTIQLASGAGVSPNSTLTLPLALSTIRESDNVVHAQNGQIVVIGGLMQNQTSETIAGTPGLSKIPTVGTLARNTNQVSQKTELVILLRPIVVNNKTWDNQLQGEAKNFADVQRGFHVGGLPEDFGTEGEKLLKK